MNPNTKDFVEVLEAGFDMQGAISKSLEDGKVNWTDGLNFLPALRSMGAAFDGIENVPKALRDYPEETRTAAMEVVDRRFDIKDDEKEALIEDTLDLVIRMYQVGSRWVPRKAA